MEGKRPLLVPNISKSQEGSQPPLSATNVPKDPFCIASLRNAAALRRDTMGGIQTFLFSTIRIEGFRASPPCCDNFFKAEGNRVVLVEKALENEFMLLIVERKRGDRESNKILSIMIGFA